MLKLRLELKPTPARPKEEEQAPNEAKGKEQEPPAEVEPKEGKAKLKKKKDARKEAQEPRRQLTLGPAHQGLKYEGKAVWVFLHDRILSLACERSE